MKLTPKIQKAIIKSAELHCEQKRKTDGSPYVMHPYSVAFILTNYTDDEDIIAAALLHDVLEDVSGYSVDGMRRDFGDKITKTVQMVSEDKKPEDTREMEKATWQRRKQGYIENLKNADFDALMVCAADKIHNLKCMIEGYKEQGEKLWDKFNAPIEERLKFTEEVLAVLKNKLDNEIVKELEQTYFEAKSLFK